MRGKRISPLGPIPYVRIIPAHAGQTFAADSFREIAPDHPRACGANRCQPEAVGHRHGSSPRMRGKRHVVSFQYFVCRIIPAHAGQTIRRTATPEKSTDHPRACGANITRHAGMNLTNGSSPRMRGKLILDVESPTEIRIIPAHAGQTSPPEDLFKHDKDHPRACGANRCCPPSCAPSAGSSPRMRGKRPLGLQGDAHHRIIPAHAGQTAAAIIFFMVNPDHPRACGANSLSPCTPWPDTGSSPRMRGKLAVVAGAHHTGRIIPAHAGQTAVRQHRVDGEPDHPRACGANAKGAVDGIANFGSSPRMRGKREHLPAKRLMSRIIPAHAGQTPRCRPSGRWLTDHPRACGANAASTGSSSVADGSSPRMRGKLFYCLVLKPAGRIIPAHAGQTQSGERVGGHVAGSSPRMRGKLQVDARGHVRGRIIPAHAGQT